jgi:HK97 family phage major capsid protein
MNALAEKPAKPVTEQDLANAIGALKKATDEVKTFAESAEKEMKAQGKLTEDLKAQCDAAVTKYAAVLAQLGDIEQKLAARYSGGFDAPVSAGGFVIGHENFQKINSSWKGRTRVEVPRSMFANGMRADIMSVPAASGGVLVEEQRIPGIVATPNRSMTIRSLLAPGRTTSNAFKYIRELGYVNAAAVVTEGGLKPESNITFESVTGNVATIAHWIKASTQILDDAPGLQSYIDARLRYGLAFVEEAELLRGDGTGEHLEGLVTAATAYSAPFNPAGTETVIDTVRLAILQVFLAQYPADGIVLNPIDWARVELTKTTDGQYVMSNPANQLTPRLWGLPVIPTLAMNSDEFLVGAFQLGAQIFDRMDAAVELSTEDDDNFRRNMVTIRAEERLALAIYRPEAFVTGDFGNVT